MTVSCTSKAAYRDVNLTERQAAVLEMMRTREDWTNEELADALGWPINQLTGRVSELKDMKKVEMAGRCRKSKFGKSVNVVRVAN